MWPVIYIALSLVVVLIALVLFAAFDLILDIRLDENGFSRKFNVRWMGISRTIKLEGEEKMPEKEIPGKKEKKDKKKGKKEKKEKKKKWGREDVSWYLGIVRDVERPLIKLVSGLIHSVRIHNFSFDLEFGLPDPADTGMACGFLHPLLSSIKHRCRVCRYWIEPRFDDVALEFHLLATIRLRPYSLIPPVMGFVLNGKVLRSGWKLFRR